MASLVGPILLYDCIMITFSVVLPGPQLQLLELIIAGVLVDAAGEQDTSARLVERVGGGVVTRRIV